MKNITIYIASSWKNRHAVEMLTQLLRDKGHTIKSFIENAYGEQNVPFEQWIQTEDAYKAFLYDANAAKESDVTIYISPSGQDASAEVGIAWASGKTVLGLAAKGEGFGLMRKLITKWYDNHKELLEYLDYHCSHAPNQRTL